MIHEPLFSTFSTTMQSLQRTVCMRTLPNPASSVSKALTTDTAEAIRVIFSGKQCLTNEQCWQGCEKVLAEWNTFVSLRSGEKSVRDRNDQQSAPRCPPFTGTLTNWSYGKRLPHIASKIKRLWMFVAEAGRTWGHV